MKNMVHKLVKIVFNPILEKCGGLLGTTCEVVGFEDGFIIVCDGAKNVSYYALNCIKSITLLTDVENSQRSLKC